MTAPEALTAFLHRLETEPVNIDISDYSDEFCAGFLAGQRSIVEEMVSGRVAVPEAVALDLTPWKLVFRG